MDLLEALNALPKLVEDHRRITAELIEVKRELESLKSDGYVGWDWVCAYLEVELYIVSPKWTETGEKRRDGFKHVAISEKYDFSAVEPSLAA